MAKRVSSLFTALVLASGCRSTEVYRIEPSKIESASSIAPYAMESGDVRLGVYLDSVDGLPIARNPLKFFEIPRLQTKATKIASGERELLVQIIFMRTGLKNGLMLRSGPFRAEIPVKVTFEPKHDYQFRGEVRGKSCVAWVEDSTTGESLKVQSSSAPFRSFQEPRSFGSEMAGRAFAEVVVGAVFR